MKNGPNGCSDGYSAAIRGSWPAHNAEKTPEQSAG